jgi:signal transduction histidine kinase
MKRPSKAGGDRAKTKRRNPAKRTRGKAPRAARGRHSSAGGQADIARLTQELKEAHAREAAAAEVLRIISSSRGGLEPVFRHMLDDAVRLCDAKFGNIYLIEQGAARLVATYNTPPAFIEFRKRTPPSTDPKTPSGRLLRTKAVVHVPDLAAEDSYREGHPGVVAAVELLGERTSLHVPMLKEGELVGYLSIYRQEVRPFTDKQIKLVQTFADQAVIAIENVRLFEEIQDKNRQLAVASQHKSQFLANMSHELRTPLNAILGYAELIADGVYGQPPDRMLAVLRRLESNGRHLLGLINDVLDLSKIEAGQFSLDLIDYSLQDIAQAACSTLEPLAADKGLAFRIELDPNLPSGRGDKRRLTQVLINLAGNAIKFTDAGEVAIALSSANGAFTVAVQDTGPGISPADQMKLFQDFQQGDNAISRSKGGTGLGLAISKRIIEMHGGRIWVDSAPGRGSTFWFTLPVRVERAS